MTLEKKLTENDLKIEESFRYRKQFDTQNVRKRLGLNDGGNPGGGLPVQEIVRLVGMLNRATEWDPSALTRKDIIDLRASIPNEDNPFTKKICRTHGEWYHDSFGCMHHDHTDPHPTDKPSPHRVCKF